MWNVIFHEGHFGNRNQLPFAQQTGCPEYMFDVAMSSCTIVSRNRTLRSGPFCVYGRCIVEKRPIEQTLIPARAPGS